MHFWAYIGWIMVAMGYSLLLVFVVRRFQYLWQEKQRSITKPLSPISIVIAAKNEAANLRKNLPQVLAQDYPHFEVIVVDDHSTDDTAQVVASIKNTRLRYFALPKTATGKKAALAYGIEKAAFPQLVFTDADCWPAGDSWLAAYGRGQQQAAIVIGYSPIWPGRGLLNKLVQYETWITALLYLSSAAVGKAYMAVGRNWGYEAAIFRTHNGFAHKHLLSGDDDLMLQQLMTVGSVTPLLDKDSWMWTESPHSWSEWWRQKRRHISTGWHYRAKDLCWLGLWTLSYGLYLVGIVLLFFVGHGQWAMLAIIVRSSTQFAIFEKSVKQLGGGRLRPWLLGLDLAYAIYIVLLVPLLALMRPVKWM